MILQAALSTQVHRADPAQHRTKHNELTVRTLLTDTNERR
jgi:hypothetical protein